MKKRLVKRSHSSVFSWAHVHVAFKDMSVVGKQHYGFDEGLQLKRGCCKAEPILHKYYNSAHLISDSLVDPETDLVQHFLDSDSFTFPKTSCLNAATRFPKALRSW